MSYYEGSNWQAKKEDEGKPLFETNPSQPMSNTQLNPETLKAIEQQSQNKNCYNAEDYRQAYHTGYVMGASDYALRLQQVEQENERLRKALERISNAVIKNTTGSRMTALAMKSIATEALKQTP